MKFYSKGSTFDMFLLTYKNEIIIENTLQSILLRKCLCTVKDTSKTFDYP